MTWHVDICYRDSSFQCLALKIMPICHNYSFEMNSLRVTPYSILLLQSYAVHISVSQSVFSLYPQRALWDRFGRLCGISAKQEYQGRTCPGFSVCVPQGDDRSDRFSGVERSEGRVWGVLPHLILLFLFIIALSVPLSLYHAAHLWSLSLAVNSWNGLWPHEVSFH